MLVHRVLMQLPPFLKVVFMVMLSLEAAKAFDIVVITRFEICDRSKKILFFFYLYSLLQEYN